MLTRYPGARGGAALGARRGAGILQLAGYFGIRGTSLSFIITPLTHSSYRIDYLFSEKVVLRVKKSSTSARPRDAARGAGREVRAVCAGLRGRGGA